MPESIKMPAEWFTPPPLALAKRIDPYIVTSTVRFSSAGTGLSVAINPHLPSPVKARFSFAGTAPSTATDTKTAAGDDEPLLALIRLGSDLSAKHRFEEAEEVLRKAICFDPTYPVPVGQLGAAFGVQKRHAEAGEAFRKVTLLDPTIASFWGFFGDTLVEQGRHKEAEGAYRKALRLEPVFALIWIHLGTAVLRQKRFQEAESLYRDAIRLEPATQLAWTDLGLSLLQQARPVEAEEAFRRAIRIAPRNTESWKSLGITLAIQELYVDAWGAFQQANALAPDDSDVRGVITTLIGELLDSGGVDSMLAILSPHLDWLIGFGFAEEADRMLRAARTALDTVPYGGMALDRDGVLTLNAADAACRRWQVASALGDIRDRLVALAATADGDDRFLAPLQGVGAIAARAALDRGLPQDAVTALERGLAVGIGHTLSIRRASLERLRFGGHPGLADRFTATLAAIRGAELQDDWTRRQRLHMDLQRVIDDIRGVDPAFLTAPNLDEIHDAARDTPLVYLFAAPGGGGAVIVTAGVMIPMLLPQLDHRVVKDKVAAFLDAQHKATLNRRPNDVLAPLLAFTGWLWEAAMGPLGAALDRLSIPAVTLIPAGALAVAPLSAAWRMVDGRRRHALEDRLINVVPSARFLKAAGRKAPKPAPAVLAVLNPTGDVPEIADGFRPVHLALGNAGRRVATLEREAVTEAAVLRALADADGLYWAGHGKSDLERPRQGRLLLAGDRSITLGSLIDGRALDLDWAVLAACEVGRNGQRLPDEALSFPSGLMVAGVRTVVAPLWAVPVTATTHLMKELLVGMCEGSQSPAEALRAAQLAMLDQPAAVSTNATLRAAAGGTSQCSTLEAESAVDPLVCWAAFQCIGR